MFKDIKIFKDSKLIEYTYKMDNEILLLVVENIEQSDSLKIVYDENIYQVSFDDNIKYQNLNAGEVLVYLEKNAKNISFKFDINYKFFIKTVYKFINKFIDKDILIQEINLFKLTEVGKKYKNELTRILDEIENSNVSIKELLLKENNEQNRINDLLLNNALYTSLAKQMSNQDLMLLITSYILAPMVPKVDQETFDNLVKSATKYDHSLEHVWRLGMNYDCKGFNYDLLDNFFVSSKDREYLIEYISGVIQVNHEKIVKILVQMNDKEFIKKLLEDDFIQSSLEAKYKDDLKQALGKEN